MRYVSTAGCLLPEVDDTPEFEALQRRYDIVVSFINNPLPTKAKYFIDAFKMVMSDVEDPEMKQSVILDFKQKASKLLGLNKGIPEDILAKAFQYDKERKEIYEWYKKN